ncbi:hypothetical protein [Proteiniborus sp.]|uniref:hypothetical protein n=1 Tax=Proteiniborus sp. TaxID=2079015 RepID=UPI00332E6BAD
MYIDKATIEKIRAIISKFIEAINEIWEKIKKIIMPGEKPIIPRAPKKINYNKILAISKRPRLFYCRNNC